MAELIAIPYPEEATAGAVHLEAEHLARALGLPADALASIVRTREGIFRPSDRGHRRASWELFWGALFGSLFFVPYRRSIASSASPAARAAIARSNVDQVFVTQVRAAMGPGTSALFLLVDRWRLETTLGALRRFGGTPLLSSLSNANEDELRAALPGAPRPEAVAV
jgi:uncharacterized membrane protein